MGDQVDRDAILFANEAFYRAFAGRNFAAMDDLWAKNEPVACIHPGWGPLTGRAEVMASWEAILNHPSQPAVTCHAPMVQVHGDTACVICFEEVGGAYLLATNVFIRDGGVWRMVHHQAGPTSAVPPRQETESGAGRPN
jgi:ketosteroid isomerase-like protein